MIGLERNKSGNKRGMSPNSRKNLELGHKPNIRAKRDYSITRIIKEMLDLPADVVLPGADGTKTWRQLIARAVLYGAAKGETAMVKELFDRLEGKVLQPVGGEGGSPIKTEVTVVSQRAKELTEAVLAGKGTE